MQMRIRPAHDGLNDVVKPVEFDATWHHEISPDARLDVKEGDLQFHCRDRGFRFLDCGLGERRGEFEITHDHDVLSKRDEIETPPSNRFRDRPPTMHP